MGLNKSAYLRYRVINKCLLRKNLKWTWQELAEACGNELRNFYGKEIDNPSEKTIKNDITDMDSLYGEKADLIRKNGKDLRLIEYDRAKKTYYYTDPTFSIDKVKLSKKHEKALTEAIDLLKQFENLPFFRDFNSVIGKISLVAKEHFNEEVIIDFEQIIDYDGYKNVQTLYECIKNRIQILVWYRPFKIKKVDKIMFEPYLLKEFNNRWFVIGWDSNEKRQTILGLSRILKIEETANNFERNKHFNPIYNFSDIIGISTEIGHKKIEEIILSFSPIRGQYVITKPIHKSQRIICDNDKEVKIELRLKINRELITEMLSFGSDVVVISPPNLRNLIISKLRQSLNNY